MLLIQHLISSVKSKVGVMYHNKVGQLLFEFLKSHPSILSWTDYCEAIVNGTHLQGTNVHDMIDYLFHHWRKLFHLVLPSKSSHEVFSENHAGKIIVAQK